MSQKNISEKSSYNVPKRVWLWLPVIDGYVFKEFIVKFSVILLLASILFSLGNFYNDFGDFLDNGTKFTVMMKYFLLLLPGDIRFVLPISVLLGCMWTMAVFGKNLEVTAMRANGLSLFRCGGSIIIMGLVVTGVNIWFYEQVVPECKRSADFISQAEKKHKNVSVEHRKRETIIYNSFDDLRSWVFGTYEGGSLNEQVMVKFYRKAKVEGDQRVLQAVLEAESSKFFPEKGWEFYNVRFTPYTANGLMAKQSVVSDKKFFSLEEIPETQYDIVYSASALEDLPSWMIVDFLVRTPNMQSTRRAQFITVLCHRLAYPWSCLLAALIGIPLATKNERSGIMLAFVGAVGVIVGYIVISQVFMTLGQRGRINPYIAGLMPTLVFVCYGFWRLHKNQS